MVERINNTPCPEGWEFLPASDLVKFRCALVNFAEDGSP